MTNAFEFMEKEEEAIGEIYEKTDSIEEAVEVFTRAIRVLKDAIPKYEHMHDHLKQKDDPHLVYLRREMVGAIKWVIKRLESEVETHGKAVG